MEPEEKPPRDEPAVEPEPSMVVNIPLPKVELLKDAPAEPCPTPPPIPLLLALRASR
jgi:hypothetical protein